MVRAFYIKTPELGTRGNALRPGGLRAGLPELLELRPFRREPAIGVMKDTRGRLKRRFTRGDGNLPIFNLSKCRALLSGRVSSTCWSFYGMKRPFMSL